MFFRNVYTALPLHAAWYPQESSVLQKYLLFRNQLIAVWMFDPFALYHSSFCPRATDGIYPWRLTTSIRIVLFLRVIHFCLFYMLFFILIAARLTTLWSVSKAQTCQITCNMRNNATRTTDTLNSYINVFICVCTNESVRIFYFCTLPTVWAR